MLLIELYHPNLVHTGVNERKLAATQESLGNLVPAIRLGTNPG